MKYTQGSYMSGYVTMLIRGDRPELFFQKCAEKGLTVWNIHKINADECKGNIKLNHIKTAKKLRRGTNYKLFFLDRKGYPFIWTRLLRKKPLLIGLFLSMILIFLLSNMIWKVEIEGVPTDIEEKMINQLDDYGIQPGAWKLSLESPQMIQQNLLEDIPELLWVGVDQKGTTFYLEGVEKVVVEEEEAGSPGDLVAEKPGVIQRMFIERGMPKVNVNDYVNTGDLLVSGRLSEENNEEEEDAEEEDEEENEENIVRSEGEVIATTWYEVDTSIPLEYTNEYLTGNHEKRYYLLIGDRRIPIWGFANPEFENIHRDVEIRPIEFLGWETPIQFVSVTLSEKTKVHEKRTKEEAIQVGMEQAKHELKLELGPDAEIISEKVLQERTENGTVNLNLYITVQEDIAQEQPINQGDGL